MRRQINFVVLSSVISLAAAQGQPTAALGNTTAQPFVAGTPLKPTPNVKTFGGFRFAESISYDTERDLLHRGQRRHAAGGRAQ